MSCVWVDKACVWGKIPSEQPIEWMLTRELIRFVICRCRYYLASKR